MKSFWNGFEKQAGILQAGQAMASKVMPKAQAAWQTAKPKMQAAWTQAKPKLDAALVKGKAMAAKGKAEVMKTPQRALGAGLAAGAAGTYALTRPQEAPTQYGAMSAYY